MKELFYLNISNVVHIYSGFNLSMPCLAYLRVFYRIDFEKTRGKVQLMLFCYFINLILFV